MVWQAQLRLCRRDNRLIHKAKAREMIAYIWAISREVIASLLSLFPPRAYRPRY